MADEKTKAESDCESGMFPSAAAEAERSLRERAQRQARANSVHMPDDLTDLSPDAAGKLFHELRVHQIELVFVTGGAFGPVAAEYLSVAGNTKIDKPFDNGEFANVVSSRIRESKSEPPTGIGPGARK
jgi:hypothetical protein